LVFVVICLHKSCVRKATVAATLSIEPSVFAKRIRLLLDGLVDMFFRMMVYWVMAVSLDWLGVGPHEKLVTFLAGLQRECTKLRVRGKAVGAAPNRKDRLRFRLIASIELAMLWERLFVLGSAVEVFQFVLINFYILQRGRCRVLS
jgi:hypothetical protein